MSTKQWNQKSNEAKKKRNNKRTEQWSNKTKKKRSKETKKAINNDKTKQQKQWSNKQQNKKSNEETKPQINKDYQFDGADWLKYVELAQSINKSTNIWGFLFVLFLSRTPVRAGQSNDF